MMISIIHLATFFNIAAAVSNGGSGVNNNIINNNNKNNNNRHLQTSCSAFDDQKTACVNAGCTWEGGRFKLCVGELPWETDPPTSAQPTTSQPTSSEPTKNPTTQPTDSPVTPAPITNEPTTNQPTSDAPTLKPITNEPTTSKPTTDMPTSQPIPDGMGYCSHDPAVQCMTVNDCNGCQAVRRRLQEEEGRIFSKDTVRDLQSCASTDGANCKKQNDCCTGLECFNYGGGRKECRMIVVSTPGPTPFPTPEPTSSPTTKSPTTSPVTSSPTDLPSHSPSNSPTTNQPSSGPSTSPTNSPSTSEPTGAPTPCECLGIAFPTNSPVTNEPTSSSPSSSPTESEVVTPLPTPGPSVSPSKGPTSNPSLSPSKIPTGSPVTNSPSKTPSSTPSRSPSKSPSKAPSVSPTSSPTLEPSQSPLKSPSKSPSQNPTTESPSKSPSSSPVTSSPSKNPSSSPVTDSPSSNPSTAPTESPSVAPSKSPTLSPSNNPTSSPSKSVQAFDDTAPTPHGTLVPVDVLANDMYPVGAVLTVTIVPNVAGRALVTSQSTHGDCVVVANQVEYTPSSGFDGQDSCQYEVCDSVSGSCDTAMVYVEVGTPSLPVANDDETDTFFETQITVDVLGNDTQAESLTLDVRNITTDAASGTCVKDGNGVKYTPDAGFVGPDSCVYTACVIGSYTACDTATLSIDVSAAPTTNPTQSPSNQPTSTPSQSPSKSPSEVPSVSPSKGPSVSPTKEPTTSPSLSPSKSPSKGPSLSPVTSDPTSSPSKAPVTDEPTSSSPSLSPTKPVTLQPTSGPSASPNRSPTSNPSSSPTTNPTHSPSESPSTSQPSTLKPTTSSIPTPSLPSMSPINSPTVGPIKTPTAAPLTPLANVGNDGLPAEVFPLQECQGDCDNDGECAAGLYCFGRGNNLFQDVPGCSGGDTDSSGRDYCFVPPPNYLFRVGNNGAPAEVFPLGRCLGDCDNDSECAEGLVCYQRNGDEETPGCYGPGRTGDDYCVDPDSTITPSSSPSTSPSVSLLPSSSPSTASPTGAPTLDEVASIFDEESYVSVFGCNNPIADSAPKAVDKSTDMYVCDRTGQSQSPGMIIIPSHNKISLAKSLRVYSNADCSGCDPVKYTLEGRSEPNAAWTVISSGDLLWTDTNRNAEGQVLASSYESGDSTKVFAEASFVSNSNEYFHYKLTFPETRETNAGSLSFAEVELPGIIYQEYASMDITATLRMQSESSTSSFVQAISCPSIASSKDIAPSTKIANLSTSVTFCGIFILSAAGNLIPYARTYNGYDWEAAPGPLAASPDSISCVGTSNCNIMLPLLADPSSKYIISTKDGSSSKVKDIARFLEMVSFGPKKTEIEALDNSGSWDDVARANYVRSQMDKPKTSHREYFRRRSNSKWDSVAVPARSDHPCSPNTKWRRYSYVEQDRQNTVTEQYYVSTFETVPEEADMTYTLHEADSLSNDVSGCGTCNFKSASTTGDYGWSGTGFYDFAGIGDYLEFTIDMTEGGTYPLSFRYALSSTSFGGRRPCVLLVNNITVAPVYDFIDTDNWSYWKYSELIDVSLNAGPNTIKLLVQDQNGGPNIDHARIGKPAAIVMKTGGWPRVIAKAGLHLLDAWPFTFTNETQVTFDYYPNAPQGDLYRYNYGRLRVLLPNGEKRFLEIGNPPVDFTGYEQYLPANIFQFGVDDIFIDSATDLLDYPINRGQELLRTTGFSGPICDWVPPFAEPGDQPVFGKLPNGEWLIWSPTILWEPNGPSINDAGDLSANVLIDGGGSEVISTGTLKCSNVPRSVFNEDTCFLSTEATACSSSQPVGEVTQQMNETIITSFHQLPEPKYVYAVQGLAMESKEESPCHPDRISPYSRWIREINSTCTAPSVLQPATTTALTNAITGPLVSANDYVLDVYGSLACDASDYDDKNDPIDIQIQIDGDCYTHVHPDNFNVYDFTGWVTEHPGGEYNIQKWAFGSSADPPFEESDNQTWTLIYPYNGNERAPKHPMNRWVDNGNSVYIQKVTRLGDDISYRDLPNDLKSNDVADFWGATAQDDSLDGGLIVCGSPGEVTHDPTMTEHFDVRSNEREVTSSDEANNQKSVIWNEIAVLEDDQLRQRMAWALAQLVTVVPSNIDGYDRTEIYTSYYDIFVRNAFGNYRDILSETSASPLMAEHLSYLRGKSHSYVFEDEDKRISRADENYAREVMQLFTIGLVQLNDDGTPVIDPETGNPIETYTNDDIESFARAWTGFDRTAVRSNYEEVRTGTSDNRLDPMKIVADWRDEFPKSNLNGGFIGDRYALCTDLPSKSFLKKSAKYRLLGGKSSPELMKIYLWVLFFILVLIVTPSNNILLFCFDKNTRFYVLDYGVIICLWRLLTKHQYPIFVLSLNLRMSI